MLGFSPASAELGALSFKLHRQLAEKDNGYKNWGYSKSTGTTFAEGLGRSGTSHEQWMESGGSRAEAAGAREFVENGRGPAWLLRKDGDDVEVVTKDGTAAQV